MNAELSSGLFLLKAKIQAALQNVVADVLKGGWIARNAPSGSERPSVEWQRNPDAILPLLEATARGITSVN
jgi:hypothetical protein